MWIQVREYTINVAEIVYFEISGDADDYTLYAHFGRGGSDADNAILDPLEIMRGTKEECIKLPKMILQKCGEDVMEVVFTGI